MVGSWFISNNNKIQIGDTDIMTYVYGSSGSIGSRVSSKSIGHTTYTGRRSNFRSKPTPINGPVHKSENQIWIIHTQEVTLLG